MVCDALMCQLEERFAATLKIVDLFNFILGKKLVISEEEVINEKIATLCKLYKTDLDEEELKNEILPFKPVLKEILNIAKKDSIHSVFKEFSNLNLQIAYPNIDILFRLFLVLPPTSVSCERSFSKLKIIKNYLRNTTSQDRLSNLSILSIEKRLIDECDFDDVIDKFATIKSRKINL